jgi:peptidyl-prolyl cis-trans isomerase A (cyclophilin A)
MTGSSIRTLLQFHFVACLIMLVNGCSSDGPQGPPSMADRLASSQERMKAALRRPERNEPAPEESEDFPKTGSFKVQFETSAGKFVILVHRDWAPRGANRFYELVQSGFYDECRFFRVMPGFMVQFGINGDPKLQSMWARNLTDDPPKQSNKRGYVTFAMAGPNSRTTQVFINHVDNTFLDSQGFSPFGEVIEGMQNVIAIYSDYGESPQQGSITSRGNEYLKESFPELDYISKATIIEETKE